MKLKGFSVVELMVALSLGLLVSLGAAQLFVNNQKSSRLNTAMAEVQEGGRFALDMLTHDIEMAGFDDSTTAGIVFAPPTLPISGQDGGNQSNDQITISYESANDCEGTASVVAGIATNVYSINNINQLICDGGNDGTNIVLLDGVENFQILYGVDTEADNIPNQYVVPSAAITAGIVSIRIGLLLRSTNAVGVDPYASKQFTVLDQTLVQGSNVNGTTLSFSDGRLRRVFIATVAVRNNITGG